MSVDAPPALLEMQGISKQFSGVQALADVNLRVDRGEILAVLGENGAGKSTLMKILAGLYPAGSYDGEILLDGISQRFSSVADAEAAGITIIPQELIQAKHLSVAENLFANHLPGRFGVVDWQRLYDDTWHLLAEFDVKATPQTPMHFLTRAEQQLVEIAKALSRNARVLILDEPTSALTDTETQALMARLRQLKARGVTCFYISHRIEEIMVIADRVLIMRDGHVAGGGMVAELDHRALVAMIVGRNIREMYPAVARVSHDVPLLEVRHLTLEHPDQPGRKVVEDINFTLAEGEILGIYGLLGSGRTELLTAIFGAWPRSFAGEVHLRGRRITLRSPKDAIRQRIGLITEDRKRTGLVLGQSINTNVSLANLDDVSQWGVLDTSRELHRTNDQIKALSIKAPGALVPVDKLSGGNQQKVVIARWLTAAVDVLLADEPTQGVDVGAKVEIFHLLNRLAREGKGIVFVSSELDEVLGISDRLLVLHGGRLVAQVTHDEFDKEEVMRLATGGIRG